MMKIVVGWWWWWCGGGVKVEGLGIQAAVLPVVGLRS